MAMRHRDVARLKVNGKEVSNRKIAEYLGISRNKVNEIVNEIKDKDLSFERVSKMKDEELKDLFLKPNIKRENPNYVIPDYENLVKELAQRGVTIQLLWEEYVDHCRLIGKQGYQLTQFREKLNNFINNNEFKDILVHRAGEQIQVDWAGDRPHWTDPDTGEIIYGWLFGGILPFSGLAYVQITSDMKMDNWIDCHINMFEYFGGVARILTSDNLKVGITKHTKEEIIINRTYEDMANYYGTTIIPGRVRKPRDKNQVENLMLRLEQTIIGRLRNHQFFSIDEYNEAARKELERFNNKPFQKKEGTRRSLFELYEKETLLPLPNKRYEIAIYRNAKVQNNSHIVYMKNYYSVPYKYIGKEVELKITRDKILILYAHVPVCEHELENKYIGRYITDISHMPEKSNAYGEWNSTRYLNWAKQNGPYVYEVVYRIFQSVKIEQRRYRTVHSLLKLADVYSDQRLEHACQIALDTLTLPMYRDIKHILKSNIDICQDEKEEDEKPSKFTRGGDYFG